MFSHTHLSTIIDERFWQFIVFLWKFDSPKSSQAGVHNHGKNICRLFHIFVQFPLTKSKRKLHCFHQKMNTRVAERLKAYDLRKLGDIKQIPEILGTDGKVLSWSLKNQILTVVLQNCKKSAMKHSIDKPILFNFVIV